MSRRKVLTLIGLILLPCLVGGLGPQLKPFIPFRMNELSEEVQPGRMVELFDRRLQPVALNWTLYLPLVRKEPATYYVSKAGNNKDGWSWTTAWNELDQINWTVLRPGDVILLDGGTTEMVYETTLTIGANGTPNSPIRIRLAEEVGRNGKAVIFGGRSTLLPYCGQTNYTFETAGVREVGIFIGESSWVVIDGTKWSGITVHGHNQFGVDLYSEANSVLVRNVEIYDNGRAVHSADAWRSNLPGVNLSGTNVTFERAIIHDNGQDAFQSGDGVTNFTLRQAWLYNGRRHPTVDASFNYCSHADGIQIFGGGSLSGLLIEESVIGTGLTNGVILGQTLTANGVEAVVNDVTFNDVLFAKAADNNILSYPHTKPHRWILNHVTAHCPNTTGHCLYLEGFDHTVANSIVYGSRIFMPDGLDIFSGNCQWNTEGFTIGQIVDPLFVNVDDTDPFSMDNYALQPSSPCAGAGSGITSVTQLLSLPDLNGGP